MINNVEIYKIWAPDDEIWTAWAKPVVFANMSYSKGSSVKIPKISAEKDLCTMIIIDLPGKDGVEEALAFAAKGYRPVPLYNGTTGSGKMLVDAFEIKEAMFSGTNILKNLSFSSGSPPVFMLDSNRMNGSANPGYYDNRWCVFQQDMPSAQYLKSKGINKIILRTADKPKTDLERILCDYQKNGIALYIQKSADGFPKEFTAKKQSQANEFFYRFKVLLGLKRNATGGFGGAIPDAYESGGSGHYYRIG